MSLRIIHDDKDGSKDSSKKNSSTVISVNKKKVSSPGYLVKRNEEDMIEYFGQTMELGAAIVEKKENK